MQIPLTPEQFATLQQKLGANPSVVVAATGPFAGTVGDSEATLGYIYDGARTLTISVLAKHGLARFAPESEVESKITQLVQENL